jgi:hypothetical protein
VSAQPPPPDPEPESRLDIGRFALDVRRLADRLRSLPQSRIQVRLDPAPTVPSGLEVSAAGPLNRAALALALAQHLADTALGVEHRDAPAPPPRRLVPTLTVFAVGDQVGVTGTDLVGVLRGLEPGDAVWTTAGIRGTAGGVLADCQDAVAAVARVV